MLPTPESFRTLIKADEDEIVDALRPDQAEASATSKASKIWRALRIASRDRFHLFNKFVDTPDEDRNELEMLFEIEEQEHEAKRVKLEENVNGVKDRDRLSVVPETQQNQQQQSSSPSAGGQRAVSAPSTVPALISEENKGRETLIESPLPTASPTDKKVDPQPQQQQRIENVANLNNPGLSPNQPKMKLHRIESAVTS